VKYILFLIVAAICGMSALINLNAGNRGAAITFGAIALFWVFFAIKARSDKK